MYTIDCEDSNCVKCNQDSEGQNSEEENQKKILMTVQELVPKDLRLASDEKAFCLDSCRKIKDQIHGKISDLIGVLRERERDLCAQVDQECYAQMTKIDRDATARCIDKLLKRNSEPETAPCRTPLFFTCDYPLISSKLQKFGRVTYTNPMDLFLAVLNHKPGNNTSTLPAGNTAGSTTPLANPFETLSLVGIEDELDRLYRESEEMLRLTEEDDLEIISRSEVAGVASELPALPPKSRFWFAKEPSCFPSQYMKKPPLSRENNSASERNRQEPICECLTHSENCITLDAERKRIPSFKRPSSQESFSKCLTNSKSCISLGAERKEIPFFKGPLSQESSSKCLTNSESCIILEAERKEIPSFKGPSSQESFSECLGDSNAEGQGRDPSTALRSSFSKYLEKNRDGEWLVSEKSSEQSLS